MGLVVLLLQVQLMVGVGNMEGKLFSGRIYDYPKIRQYYPKALLICVMRWPPRMINLKKKRILHFVGLAPSLRLLNNYKKRAQKKLSLREEELVWEDYIETFYEEQNTNEEAIRDKDLVRNLLRNGTDVVLLCHEKSHENCHRKLLPDIILTKTQIENNVYQGEVVLEDIVQMKLGF